MIKIKIDDHAVLTALRQLRSVAGDLTPTMRAIAGVLADQTEQNFADQAGPTGKWAPLKDKRRAGGRILQDTGRLAASIHTRATADSAVIGTNVIYAAIHQLGGRAGRGQRATIPARPYLPVSRDGRLQAGVEQEMLAIIDKHIRRAAGG